MTRAMITGLVSLSLLATASVATAQQAQKQRDSQNDQQQTGQRQESQQQANQRSAFQRDGQQSERNELPKSLRQIGLNDQQKQEILSIYKDSDRKTQKLWNRVQNLHRQAISMEAAVIAATRLEGHDHSAHISRSAQQSTEDQQQKSEEAVSKNSGEAGSAVATDDKTDQSRTTLKPNTDAENRTDRRDGGQNRKADRPNDQASQKAADQSDRSQNNQASSWEGLEGDLNIVALRVGVAQPNGRVREYFLVQPTSQNEDPATCQVCQNHQNELMQVWDGIHKAHEQLVELEADTIVKVESSLTEEQLKQFDSKMKSTSSDRRNQNSEPNENPNGNSRE